MSYQVLARKWRPRTFTELVGQHEVLQTLTHALNNARLHHAYLFTGTRGVGKTTIARIIAACVNCEQGVSAEPCGKCSACCEIAEGRFIDLIEVDAASRTKVEDTRELLENVQYAPSRGRYKVYLIDEVHMLSTHSFNALLKTLEEPPPHILFLLATTDPQKLPVTILSRCLQLNLRNMTPELTVKHLQSILSQEQIPAETPALWQLARAARGSMRDALTLLDQAISHGGGQVLEANVTRLLGVPDQHTVFSLLNSICAQDAAAVLRCVETVAMHNPDYLQMLESMLGILHRVAIAQVLPEGIDDSEGDELAIRALAESVPAEDIQLYFQMALNGRQDMGVAADLRMAFEMLLLRMLAFTPHGPIEGLSTLADTDAQGEKKKPESTLTAKTPLPVEDCNETHIAQEQTGRSKLSQRLAPENWPQTVAACELTGIGANLLANCIPAEFTDETLVLILDKQQSALFNERHSQEIESALATYLACPLKIRIEIGTTPEETPAAASLRMKEQKRLQAIHNFMTDSNVCELLTVFSAQVDEHSLIVKTEELE
ncbi:MAG: DNA polymerase III subunit gamma/tau [Pseudomonadales bacterium]|nr:DNA polymerase III subunit gamma/tau [Pseudomonadales bacterium]